MASNAGSQVSNPVLMYLYTFQVAEVTFNFWYRLSEALFKGEDEAKTALFRPYFESLFEALCVHCRLESDAVSTLLPLRFVW